MLENTISSSSSFTKLPKTSFCFPESGERQDVSSGLIIFLFPINQSWTLFLEVMDCVVLDVVSSTEDKRTSALVSWRWLMGDDWCASACGSNALARPRNSARSGKIAPDVPDGVRAVFGLLCRRSTADFTTLKSDSVSKILKTTCNVLKRSE